MSRFPAWARQLALAAVALVALAALYTPALSQPGEPPATSDVPIYRWLVAGPVAAALPAFAGETGLGVPEPVGVADLLPEESGLGDERVWPREGAVRRTASGEAAAWRARAAEGGRVVLEAGDGSRPRLAWLVAYVEADRYLRPTLSVTSAHPLRVFVDGEAVGSGEGSGGEEEGEDGEAEDDEDDGAEDADAEDAADATDEADELGAGDGSDAGGAAAAADAGEDDEAAGEPVSAEIELTTGKHLVLVATVFDPAAGVPWTVSASLAVPAERRDALALSTTPERGVRMEDLLDLPGIEAADVSADGELVAVTLAAPQVPAEGRRQWVEIVRAADGATVRSLRLPGAVSGFAWAPRGRAYAYRTAGAEGRSTLWVGDLETGELEPLLADVENLASHRWAADAGSLFVVIDEEEEADERGAVRVRSLPDRWAGSRQRGVLWQVAREDGARRRLTAGVRPTDLVDVAPDGSRLLLARTDYTLDRPFTVGELVELDLATLETTALVRVPWFNDAAYAPDGRRLAISAGPSAFGDAGLDPDLPAGTVPNEYDGQLYLWSRDGSVRALTREFDPAVGAFAWPRGGGIVFQAAAGTFGRLYRLDPASGRIEELRTAVDVVDGFTAARDAATVAYWGSSLQRPAALYTLASARPLVAPAADAFEQVRFGRIEPFDFRADDGTTVEGTLYYPLDFDPDERYPLLVFYYGGVVPTDRSFGGRYPRNWWAANGYAVYVLQPSGAVGWGQELSARHVNDWGRRVSGEIQQGVRAVLAAHPFLDGERVGNFGGSYGGFLTMLLLTETDQFAAAISHAGISAIPSYWGEGWWGYLYNAVSAAGSYPWNRADLYVEQSPLFAADRIEAPLLLLHGTADPNVPPGESDQMFAALRVLGKEVEYIRIEGEQHWILSYPKRVLWWNTVMAWFDLHLKGEPEHWEELWGEPLARTGP